MLLCLLAGLPVRAACCSALLSGQEGAKHCVQGRWWRRRQGCSQNQQPACSASLGEVLGLRASIQCAMGYFGGFYQPEKKHYVTLCEGVAMYQKQFSFKRKYQLLLALLPRSVCCLEFTARLPSALLPYPSKTQHHALKGSTVNTKDLRGQLQQPGRTCAGSYSPSPAVQISGAAARSCAGEGHRWLVRDQPNNWHPAGPAWVAVCRVWPCCGGWQ